MSTPQIEVNYRPEHDPQPLGELPMLDWGHHAEHGLGWTLWYRDDDGEPTDYFIPGDLLDIDWVVRSAQEWLAVTGPTSTR